MSFSKVEVLHGGHVLEVIDNYNQLSHLLLDSQVDPSVRNTSLNMNKGCNQTYSVKKGATLAKSATGYYFTTTLISGTVDLLARNYIPVNDLQEGIQIIIALVPLLQTSRDAAPTVAASTLTVSNIKFHANTIKLSPEVMPMVRSEVYTIYSETYTNVQQSYSTSFCKLQLLIPTQYSSLKTVFTIFRPSGTANGTGYVLFQSLRVTFG